MALRLRYGDKTIVLPAGQLFLGRSPECHIVSADPQASRRHAVITMGKTGAFVTDLGSKAGVRVNGEMITGARRLARGDVILLAGLSIVVETLTADSDDEPTDPRLRATMSPPAAGPEPPAVRVAPAPPLGVPRIDSMSRVYETMDGDDDEDSVDETLSRTQEAPLSRGHEAPISRIDGPASRGHETPPSRTLEPGPTTTQEAPRAIPPPESAGRLPTPSSGRRVDLTGARIPRLGAPPTFPREGTLRALSAVGEKAIALGRAEEAERILTRALHETMDGVRRGEIDAATAELAASLAARLAGATGSGRWFDFAVSIYATRGELAPANVVDLLYAAVNKARSVDKQTFREYLSDVKSASGDSPARRFVIQRLEGLQRILDLK